ncbi:MAG: hypothetical protein GY796_15035 [Chloroflexi bacterium]|nr:hypothetical protein [Chloroflexota bacterium]
MTNDERQFTVIKSIYLTGFLGIAEEGNLWKYVQTQELTECYLAIFEKVYRFTPFSDDAQERIRGKSPLELAGYAVDKLPMTHICRGWALQWPPSAFQEFVPNV